LLWRICFQRIPIGEVLIKIKVTDSVVCCCCNNDSQETFEHRFVTCPMANELWELFADAVGIQGPFLQLKHTIDKWWNEKFVPKLKPLFRAVPVFIIWQIWKIRNKITKKHQRHQMRQ